MMLIIIYLLQLLEWFLIIYHLTCSPTVHESFTCSTFSTTLGFVKRIDHYNQVAVVWHFGYNLYVCKSICVLDTLFWELPKSFSFFFFFNCVVCLFPINCIDLKKIYMDVYLYLRIYRYIISFDSISLWSDEQPKVFECFIHIC